MQFHSAYNALVLGGSYFTKQIPTKKLTEIIEKSTLPLILLGGKEDSTTGEALQKKFPDKVYNAAGKFSLLQSASIIKQSSKAFTDHSNIMKLSVPFITASPSK